MKIDRQAIYERDGGLCGFCGQHVPPNLLHMDHYPIPRAMGGPTTPENLRVAHRHCNIAAGSRVRVGFPSRRNGPTTALTLSNLPVAMVVEMRRLAETEQRSLNFIAARLLREALDREGKRGR